MTMSCKSETRDRILEAAMVRIKHYGYAKTTMSEIAKDCGMSAGNIYRFFASKLDIAEAMARQFDLELSQTLAQLARADKPAAERLRDHFVFYLEHTFDKLDSDAKILEVAEVLSRERPEFANEELARERIYIVQTLEDGVRAGEFAPIPDPSYTAEMIQSAMMKFRFPQLFSRLGLPELRRELDGVYGLISAGLKQGVTAELVNAE
ncbi:MAG: TetR/AcrR family transcriptional regulator [Pseudomonadota bacterium]